MQQVTPSHSCRLEARNESERNRTPWLTLRQRGEGGGRGKEKRKAEKEWKKSAWECDGDRKRRIVKLQRKNKVKKRTNKDRRCKRREK